MVDISKIPGAKQKADAFNGEPVFAGVDDSWETEIDNATKIDWDKTPQVVVTFDRIETLELVDEDTGEKRELEIIQLRDYTTEELLSTAKSYQLGSVEWRKDRLYFIERTGQESMRGGRKLNLFTVKSRPLPTETGN